MYSYINIIFTVLGVEPFIEKALVFWLFRGKGIGKKMRKKKQSVCFRLYGSFRTPADHDLFFHLFN